MKNLFWPDYYYSHLEEIQFVVLRDLGIRGLAFDIDNTLCLYTEKPGKKTLDLFNRLREAGFIPFIISNGKKERVEEIASYLKCPYRAKSLKPFCFGYKNLLQANDLQCNQVAFIGDQIFTDCLAARFRGGLAIYVEPLSYEVDEKITVWKRPMEKKILKKFLKYNK